MKVIVRPDRIEFKNFLYTVVIPKATNIGYIFFDQSQDVGLPIALKVESDNMKIESPVGLLGRLIYFISKNSRFLSAEAMINRSNSPTTIYFLKEIGPFLHDLKINGYEGLDAVVAQFNNFVDRKPNPKLIPETVEWREDKLGLMIGVFIIFELVNIIVIAHEDWRWFIGVSVGLLIICAAVYLVLISVKKR